MHEGSYRALLLVMALAALTVLVRAGDGKEGAPVKGVHQSTVIGSEWNNNGQPFRPTMDTHAADARPTAGSSDLPTLTPCRVMVANKEHCFYCFDVLVAHLHGVPVPDTPTFEDTAYPLFVTWNAQARKPGGNDRLRGCIGNFSAQPLRAGLAEYALTSALRDHRFDPITLDEVVGLSCSVSLLTDFTPGEDYLDWEVGTHGIRIEFRDDQQRRRTATYLPDVALEQGWTREHTIDSLLRKGGFRGVITDKVRMSISLTRYQSCKCKVSYAEWAKARRSSSLVALMSDEDVADVSRLPGVPTGGAGSWWGRG